MRQTTLVPTVTPGFDIGDFFVARRYGLIVGVIGLWDQDGFKQPIVRGYDRSLRLLKPFYNLAGQRGYAYLMLDLSKNNPLLPLTQKYAHIDYHSRVYLGAWEEDLEIGEIQPYPISRSPPSYNSY
jgi:hypothetical protein